MGRDILKTNTGIQQEKCLEDFCRFYKDWLYFWDSMKSLIQKATNVLMSVNETVSDTDVWSFWATYWRFSRQETNHDEIRQKLPSNTRSTVSHSGNRTVHIEQKWNCVQKLFLNIFWNNMTQSQNQLMLSCTRLHNSSSKSKVILNCISSCIDR